MVELKRSGDSIHNGEWGEVRKPFTKGYLRINEILALNEAIRSEKSHFLEGNYMTRLIALLAFSLVFSVAFMADAKKFNDDITPAEETVCDGLPNGLFGLCNAYCEAQDCDLSSERKSCSNLLEHYQERSGYPGPPCVCRDVCDAEWNACVDEVAANCQVICEGGSPICMFRCVNLGVQRTCDPPLNQCVQECQEQANEQECNLNPESCGE